jgi:hypothetical protein
MLLTLLCNCPSRLQHHPQANASNSTNQLKHCDKVYRYLNNKVCCMQCDVMHVLLQQQISNYNRRARVAANITSFVNLWAGPGAFRASKPL